MKSYTLSTATVALIATVAFLQGSDTTTLKRDFSELTSFEKLLFQFTHSELYHNISGRGGSKSSGINSEISFIDLPTLALQLSKSGGALTLPSAAYFYSFYYCWIGICAGTTQHYVFSDPELRNANLTRLNTKINATNIELDFKIPDLQIVIDNFTLSESDTSGKAEFWQGLTLTITNYTVQLSANLDYVQDVGIQVSNVEVKFGVEDFKSLMGYESHTCMVEEECGAVETQLATQMMAEWEEVGSQVTADAELFLNCFLSKGRNGNADCELILADKVQTENFIQLLQSIGLGILQSEERNEVAEIKKEVQLANFLPSFPTPDISSLLLDFSTLILQLGKLLYDSQSNEFPVKNFAVYYEKTRENCTDGICRDIVHQMMLSNWILGGYSDNRVQLDIQPTNFSYSLNVPHNYLNSDEYQYLLYDLDNRYEEVYLGLQLSIVDAAFALTGDYELKEGVGLQISNLGITLRLGELQLKVPQFYTVENGEKSEVQEYKVDAAPQIMEIWTAVDEDGVSFERKYEQQIENLLNSYLRDGLSIPKLFS